MTAINNLSVLISPNLLPYLLHTCSITHQAGFFSTPFPIMKIALVDDSVFSRKQLASILKDRFGEEAELVHFGRSAEAVEAIPTGDYTAVFLDLVMPPPDGFATLEHLRQAGYERPIIVCSADIQATTKERCRILGATAYVEKPFSKEKTFAAIEEVGL